MPTYPIRLEDGLLAEIGEVSGSIPCGMPKARKDANY
jgi:hypothetical protein